ncbi:MAG TPA: bifunctional isocitrate dehydrogenase kinase/phosphatase [Acidobacteriota bacterium]|nr:bifunctional isocitrate dehydrogenase kinase/phosphatase [Acidobacteriota bacterium]
MSSPSHTAAQAIFVGFETYQTTFHTITLRAQTRFEQRDWLGMQSDAVERLNLYKATVDQVVANVRAVLGDDLETIKTWEEMKSLYSQLIICRDDWEQAETYFNSITRRIFATVGVNQRIEFVDTDYSIPPNLPKHSVYRRYPFQADRTQLVELILKDVPFATPFEDLHRDAQLVSNQLERHLKAIHAWPFVEQAEVVSAVFYRGQEAYLVGRLRCGANLVPLVLVLINTPAGVVVDAVLFEENDVSMVFSFTRSYFHVEVDRPYDLVAFLKSILPRKPKAELYNAIGYNKHGKTVLYRDLLHHLAHSKENFEIARGERGMVMIVFTLPHYDLVFKIIKDQFTYPKTATRQEVISKYQLVSKHDRAGRLIDAQEYEFLELERRRFSSELLDELLNVAGQTVKVEDDWVIIKHVFLERRVTPLNIFLREAKPAQAEAAVIDYGNSIKDLISTNIFPGDILLKNFGVTRHGRVVFYDYDELCLLTDCIFRKIPRGRSYEDDISSDPWFSVGENDIFPEEFQNFLQLTGKQRDVFLHLHGDLFQVKFWRSIQDRLRAGEVIRILPYLPEKSLGEMM